LPAKKQHAINEDEEREFESKRGKRGQAIPKEWDDEKKERYKKWLKHRHYLIKKQVIIRFFFFFFFKLECVFCSRFCLKDKGFGKIFV